MEAEMDSLRERKELLEDEIKDRDDTVFRLREEVIIERKSR